MKLTWFGTAMLRLELGGKSFLTDPALDPAGTSYDFGPWYAPRSWFASEKRYETPPLAGSVDAVLLSHDHHADNLDHAGRRWLAASDARVLAPTAAARRLAKPGRPESQPGEGLGLGNRAEGLDWGASSTVGEVRITATPCQHGPRGTPRIHEVCGFLLEAPGEPTVWISGDTVLVSEVRTFLESRRGQVDVAVIHAGGVRFPAVPVIGGELFTFDSAQVIEACRLLEPRTIVPVHREGWSHFREPAEALRARLVEAGLGERLAWLQPGETLQR